MSELKLRPPKSAGTIPTRVGVNARSALQRKNRNQDAGLPTGSGQVPPRGHYMGEERRRPRRSAAATRAKSAGLSAGAREGKTGMAR